MGNSHSIRPQDRILNGNNPRMRYIDRLLEVDPFQIIVSDNSLVCHDYDSLQRAKVYVTFVDYDMVELPLAEN